MSREYKRFTVDDYEITRNGEVINKHTGRHIKPQKNGKGYLRVGIGKKLLFVHRLVAEKYMPNPDNKPQVNRKDGNKLNNCVDNLEWVSNDENRVHALKHGLHTCGANAHRLNLRKNKLILLEIMKKSIEKNYPKFLMFLSKLLEILEEKNHGSIEKIC
jgi:hypothetical protein